MNLFQSLKKGLYKEFLRMIEMKLFLSVSMLKMRLIFLEFLHSIEMNLFQSVSIFEKGTPYRVSVQDRNEFVSINFDL